MSGRPRKEGGVEDRKRRRGVEDPKRPADPVDPREADLSKARVLVVDDEESNLRTLERVLARAGYTDLVTTSDPRRAEALFVERAPDLVLLDLHMPYMDGFEVMDALRPHVAPGSYLPLLILTGDPDPEMRQRALSAGARDFVTKPFETREVLLRIKNLLETRFLHLQLQRHNETLEARVRERTRALGEAQVEILQRLAVAAEYRDDITGRHAERVGLLSALIGDALRLSSDEVALLRRAATLHDVGKIGIPDAILMKAGPLTPQEFELMKSHTEIGGRILAGSRFPLLQMARDIALSHHERWDGQGYSQGLSDEDIPLPGRIVAVADVFDSLTHQRPYKEAKSALQAVEMIREERGRHFDPGVVDVFLDLVDQGVVYELDRMVTEGAGSVPDATGLEGAGIVSGPPVKREGAGDATGGAGDGVPS